MSAPPVFRLSRGDARLVISVPHAGIYLPPPIEDALSQIGKQVVDTDWFVDRLYSFAHSLGATILFATHSRTVVDLNRAPAGGALYPGQVETTLCPTESFDGAALYRAAAPTPVQIVQRTQTYWQPYHDALAGELDRIKALHGSAILLDGHSIRSAIPRLFAGRLPDLNFGTNGGISASPVLIARALAATEAQGFTQICDGRFRGGYITRHYGNPTKGVHAIQLELAQITYMDESDLPIFNATRASHLIDTLEKLVRALLHA